MNNIKNFHDVSAVFFFSFAFVYIFSALAFRNNFNAPSMIFLMRLLDIPFALVALSYGGSSLTLQVNEGREDTGSVWNVIIFATCIILFAGVVFVNLAFPGKL